MAKTVGIGVGKMRQAPSMDINLHFLDVNPIKNLNYRWHCKYSLFYETLMQWTSIEKKYLRGWNFMAMRQPHYSQGKHVAVLTTYRWLNSTETSIQCLFCIHSSIWYTFHQERFQVPALSQCQEMIENTQILQICDYICLGISTIWFILLQVMK